MQASPSPSTPVDLIVNCFERTYRHVLAPGFFTRIAADNQVRFERRTAVVNNVDDVDDARRLADALVAAGEIDRWVLVADHIDEACRTLGLTRADLGTAPWFTDWALVAVTRPGPDYVLFWDADVHLIEACDWITPALELFDDDARVLVANPTASHEQHLAPKWTAETAGPFGLSYGCSDQVLLGRRRELCSPIYSERTISRLRYPLAHFSYIFEARIDSYMRRNDRLRATHRGVLYEHAQEEGGSYPSQPLRVRALTTFDFLLLSMIRRLPLLPHHLRHM